ncbi:MAG TPA: serine hydrolase domain-containing protein [Vicinamibacterales bacterium]|nr:serine hydrolase domain-containing protein [Vicinamibacterales bacterium]
MGRVSAGHILEQRASDCLDRAVSDNRLVGGIVIVRKNGETVCEIAAGLADREAGRKMRADTIFRYSSLTKPIVATATMALVERGVIKLDEPVTRWLPAFRPKLASGDEPRLEVRHLLTHTAGLTYAMFQPEGGTYESAGISDGLDEKSLSMSEELERLARVPLVFSPGTAWGYSLAYDVLGAVIARAAGAPLPEAVATLVTGPLGMRDTAFSVVDPTRLAVPYVSGSPQRMMADPEVVPFAPGTAGIRFSPSRIFNPDAFASGGTGMAGTARDFLKFLAALQSDGALLKPSTTRQMMSNQIGALRLTSVRQPASAFGFGGAVLMDPALAGTPQGEGTWNWGGVYGHHWYVDPVNRLTVIALTNTALEGMVGGFVGELMNAVYG